MKIVPIEKTMIETAAMLLYQAFMDDPLSRYLYGDTRTRGSLILSLYRNYLHIMCDHGRAYTTDTLEGVALWLAPHYAHGFPFSLLLRYGLAGVLWRMGPRSLYRAQLVLRDAQQRHHSEMPQEHYALDILGVSPSAQGRGVGRALVLHGLEQAKNDGTPAYVMTHNEKNIPFYERCGFERIATKSALKKGPSTTSFRYS